MKDTIKETQFMHDVNTRSSVYGTFKTGDDISVSLIQLRCKTGYFSASRVLENLIEDGLVQAGKTQSSVCKML